MKMKKLIEIIIDKKIFQLYCRTKRKQNNRDDRRLITMEY